MKTIKITEETRAYSEEEAQDYINKAKEEAKNKGYQVGAAGYTYKTKKSKGDIVDEAWVCKITKIYNEVWD